MPDKELQLSIILPIYNVEPYLEKCIRSLENQDIPKNTYEIICVNDGSPDGCLQIIKDLEKEFDNIILIDQINQGVSVARNNGIKKAKGKYLMFVDPDDAIEENCFKSLLSYAENKQLDVVYSPLTFVEMDGKFERTLFRRSINKILKGTELYFAVRGKNIESPDRNYGILYNRKLLTDNNLLYVKDVPYLEDGEYIARVLCLAKRTGIYNKPYYLRLNRPGSATQSDLFYNKIAIDGFIKAAKNLRDFKIEHKLNDKQVGLINGRIVKFVILAVHATLKNYKYFIWVQKELKKEGFAKLELSGVDQEYYKLGKKFNRSLDYLYFDSNFINIRKSIYLRLKRIYLRLKK